MTEKKTLLSGVKPTGRPHLGNYFGAMKQFVDLQNSHESFIFIADLHALTSMQNAKELKEATYDLLLDYLAIGLDPKLVTFYKQSDVPEVTELAWIFSCLTTMPYLMRAHAFKDSEAKNKEINAGVFNYPLLMAADILLPNADIVPVGKDQKQHVEIARDTAEKFNRVFGETFKLPEEKMIDDMFTENGSMIGTDGYKMSKSNKNTIPLFSTDEEVKKLVMGIVTDSREDGAINVRAIHYPVRKALYPDEKTGDYFTNLYTENKSKYKELKEALIYDLIAFITPLRKERERLAKDRDYVLDVLAEGRAKVREIVEAKMEEIREKVGLTIE